MALFRPQESPDPSPLCDFGLALERDPNRYRFLADPILPPFVVRLSDERPTDLTFH